MKQTNQWLLVLRTPVVLTVVLGLLAGCASIIKGSSPESISIRSDPADAKITITDARTNAEIAKGSTPYIATLNKSAGYFKKAKYRVDIEKDGYEKISVPIEATPTGWYVLGNIVFGGLIGYLIVDPATGAMWTLDPEEVNVKLKGVTSSHRPDPSLFIALKNDLPPAVQQKLDDRPHAIVAQ